MSEFREKNKLFLKCLILFFQTVKLLKLKKKHQQTNNKCNYYCCLLFKVIKFLFRDSGKKKNKKEKE